VLETDIARIVLAISFFAYASASDWRTRRVKNIVWIILGTFALVLFWIDLETHGGTPILESQLLPIAFIFFDIFWERKKGIRSKTGIIAAAMYVAAFIWMGYVTYYLLSNIGVWSQYSIAPIVAFVTILIFELFYMFDVIKGGADAKALICLAILFPWYPELAANIPLIAPSADMVKMFFPFAFSALFMGALISCAVPLYILGKNVRAKRKIGAKSLLGFQIPVGEVEKHFVWLIEWVEDGKLRFSYRKQRNSETLKGDLAALKAMGLKEVWVTYKIPFIIPLTAGLLMVLFVGNLLFLVY